MIEKLLKTKWFIRRKQAEEALQKSEGMFRDAFRFSPAGMALVALDGKWLKVNASICQIVGYSEEELLALTFQDITHKDDLNDDLCYVQQMLSGEIENYQMEKRYLHKQGQIVWVQLTVSLVKDNAGKPLFFISQIQNITGLKLLQEAKIARIAADSANRAKSDFLANMSHELRTPLNSVIGFSEVLQDQIFGELNQKQQEYVNNINGSGKHLLSLINDILDIAKIESGKMELDLSTFLLKDAINSAMCMFKEKAMRHALKLAFEIEPNAGTEIEADPLKLKQILFNLLSNAVKFTPDGGSVSVSARRDGDFIEIAVADSGIGIKEEDLSKLFQTFTQLESGYTKEFEGTGLGLALTRQLVELHGGSIWVESEIGKGSKFMFVIPIRQ